MSKNQSSYPSQLSNSRTFNLVTVCFTAFFTLFTIACGEQNTSDFTLNKPSSNLSKQPIVNGKNSTLAIDNAVVRVDLGNSSCTGTLISPDLILTAGHCVGDGAMKVEFGSSNSNVTKSINVAAKHKHIGYDESTGQPRNDIALLLLLEESVNDITPITPLHPLKKLTLTDEKVRSVGFGLDENDFNGNTPAPNSSFIKKTLRVPLKKLDNHTLGGFSFGAELFSYESRDFDDNSFASVCSGDSGGPALLERDGAATHVAGVHSTVSGPVVQTNMGPFLICTQSTEGHNVTVTEYHEWILDYANETGSIIDYCSSMADQCNTNEACINDMNTPAGFTCSGSEVMSNGECNDGFDSINGECIDINECQLDDNLCSTGLTCINLQGSFKCEQESTSNPIPTEPETTGVLSSLAGSTQESPFSCDNTSALNSLFLPFLALVIARRKLITYK